MKARKGPCYPSAAVGSEAIRIDGHRRAEIAQLVEHATENRGVASSTLALGTNKAGVAQHPERKWLSW